MAQDFQKELQALLNGEKEEVYVKKEDFMTFRDMLFAQEVQKKVIGTAKIGGDIVYRKNLEV